MQEWDVLAEEPLDAFLEPVADADTVPQDDLTDVCITWRGDGKYFATVNAAESGSAQRPAPLPATLPW